MIAARRLPAGEIYCGNDKAAGVLLPARLRCRAREHQIRRAFSPVIIRSFLEKTDATCPIDGESRIARPKRL